MNVRKRKLEAQMKSVVVYTQQAAMNRGIKDVELILFIYSILKVCRPMLERYIEEQKLTDLTVYFSKFLPDGGKPIEIGGLSFAKEISEYVSGVESMALTGPGAILLDAADKSEMISKGFVTANISRASLETVAKSEQRSSSQRGQAAKDRDIDRHAQPASSERGRPAPSDILSGFCSDLTEKAKAGQVGEVFCRDELVDRLVVCLMRKIKSNPLLVGEPGVGKTAIVEAFASRVVKGEVPGRLIGCKVLSLDLGAVVGGTTLRGEFEDRMRQLLAELEGRPNIILFIDEVHMLVGAGDHTGSMDAANILKPYLARGTVKVIGATTHSDFNKHISKDGALARRFQRIYVNELSPKETLDVLVGLSMGFEKFHGVTIEKESLERIIFLTRRHIGDRHFPDKAIDCLDDACARASVAGKKRKSVDAELVEESVSNLAGVPVSVVRRKDKESVDGLSARLKSSLYGNDEALDKVCETIAAACSMLNSPDRPLCSIMLVGPSGVGKKSSIRIVAEELYGETSLVEVNGAEYSEPYSLSKILGSPPGYVGYREEGFLTRSVRRRPHSVLLVHNLPMMHCDVREQFVKIMKTGRLLDSEGNTIDFRSAIVAFCVDHTGAAPVGFNQPKDSDFSSLELDASGSAAIFKQADAKVNFRMADRESVVKAVKAEIEMVQRIFAEQERKLTVHDSVISALCQNHSGLSPAEARRKSRKELEMMVRQADKGSGPVSLGQPKESKIPSPA